jgi:hypothetical protein
MPKRASAWRLVSFKQQFPFSIPACARFGGAADAGLSHKDFSGFDASAVKNSATLL